MIRAAIALGSNLGDRRANLDFALEQLASLGEVVSVSNLYETAPIGGPDQDPYLNAAVILETVLSAHRLLKALHGIENERGRRREIRWGPRTLDLDLLLFGSETHRGEDLVVPHPRMLERRFVIEPLLNAWPVAKLPDGKAVSAFAGSVADQELIDLGVWKPPVRSGFKGRGGWWVVAQVIVIMGVVLAPESVGPSIPGGNLVKVIGAVLAGAGVIEATVGLLQLGDRLTPFPEPLDGGGIIRNGVFSLARHPIYGGIVLGITGLAVFRASFLSVGVALVASAFFWLKAGREEIRLLRRFSDYAEYQQETRARLIPWVL